MFPLKSGKQNFAVAFDNITCITKKHCPFLCEGVFNFVIFDTDFIFRL